MSTIIASAARGCQRPFLVVRYRSRPGGVLEAEVPDRCPLAAEGERGCAVRCVHLRPRKTGPRHPLWVMRCGAHGRCFTLYPHGFAPYQRFAVERRGPDGRRLVGAGASDAARVDFEGTFFEAALDAAEGRAWPRATSKGGGGAGSWGLQGRHLRLGGELLAVAADVGGALRERLGALLGVDTLTLRESARAWRERGYRARGRAIAAVLRRVRRGRLRVLRLLHAGFLLGRWGRPMLWDDRRRIVKTLPFQPPGTPQPA